MVRGARPGALALAVALLLRAGDVAAAAHPIHTTLAQLSEDRAERAVRVSVRVFADDFGLALQRKAGGRAVAPGPEFEAWASAYASRALLLADRRGRPVPLRWCGARHAGQVYWLCLTAAAPSGLRGMRVRSLFHFELYPDQVNMVQAEYGGDRESLLFTRGDPAKRIP